MKIKLYKTKENINKDLVDPFSEKDFEEITSQQFGKMLEQHGEAALENVYVHVRSFLKKYMFLELSILLETATEHICF